jgi:uncharacterized protein (DUF1330 family)
MKLALTIPLSALAGALVGVSVIETIHAQAQAPVYYIAEVDIHNMEGYKEYAAKAVPSAQKLGAKVLAAGENTVQIEGAPPKKRVVVQKWESMEKLMSWRNSAEYKANREIGNKYAAFRAFAVEGRPE